MARRRRDPLPVCPPERGELSEAELHRRCLELPDRRRPPEAEVSIEELAEVLALPWATEEAAPARRSVVTVRRAATAAMTRRRGQPRAPGISPLAPVVREPDPAEQADEEERRRPVPGAPSMEGRRGRVPAKKPAGWKDRGDSVYWHRSDGKKCRECAYVSATGAGPGFSHKRTCSFYPRSILSAMAHAAAAPSAPLPTLGPAVLPASMLAAVPRQAPPEKSPTWQEWCRRGPCINCGRPPRSTCSHEASGAPVPRRGVRQKVRDTLGTSLCWEPCHRIYTGGPGQPGGYLPDPRDSERKGKLVLRSREESLQIVHAAQLARLRTAAGLLPFAWQIEALSIGLAAVPEDVLSRALLGEAPPSAAELALIECLSEETTIPIGEVR